MYFFFFSSRRRHTRCSRDWSSDVCSSDLIFGPTELRLVLAIGNLVLYFSDSSTVKLIGGEYRLFDVGGAVGIVGMALMLIVATIRHTRTLYHAEMLP